MTLRRREALTVAGFSAVSALLALAANRLLTQTVAPDALGGLYLYTNLAMWLTLPSAAAFVYVGRHWSVAQASGAVRRFSRALGKGLALQALFAAVGALGLGFAGSIPRGAIIALAVVCIGQAVYQVIGVLPAVDRRRVLAGLLDIFGTPVRLLILAAAGALLAWQTGEKLLQAQALWAVLAGVAALLALRHLLRKAAPESSEPLSQELSLNAFASYAVPFALAAMLDQLCASAERFGLASLKNLAATALFTQAIGLARAGVGACTSWLAATDFPVAAQTALEGENPVAGAAATIRRHLRNSALALSAIAVGGALLAGTVTPILFGKRYAGVEPLLPWAILGACLSGFGQSLAIVPYVARDPLGPNLARSASQLLYVALLVFVPVSAAASASAELAFCKRFVAANLVYVVLMAILSYRVARRR